MVSKTRYVLRKGWGYLRDPMTPVIIALVALAIGIMATTVAFRTQADQNQKLKEGLCGLTQPIAVAPQNPSQPSTDFGRLIRQRALDSAKAVECSPDPFDQR